MKRCSIERRRKSEKSSSRSTSAEPQQGTSASDPSTEQRPTVEQKLRPGLEAAVEKVIPHEWTLAHFDSDLPAVLSTPAMIGMMEVAAASAIRAELPAGAISVGTRIEVDHLKAVPEGTLVRAVARLAEHKGRFMAFDVEARAGEHLIGRGRVYRAIVEPGKFHAQARARKP